MNVYCIEVTIRKRGVLGWFEHQLQGIRWSRQFECRKSIPELQEGTRRYFDGVIADMETIDNFN